MTSKISSCILLIANLAHNENFWTFISNMLLQLSSCHMLEFRSIADVTAKFRAIKLCMCLQFTQSFPNDWTLSIYRWTSMWKFTEVNAVFQNFIYFLQEITFYLAIWATDFEIRCQLFVLSASVIW